MEGNTVIPAFDPDYGENSTMYCTADGDGGVYRFVKGESSVWTRIDVVGAPTSEAVTGVTTEVTAADSFTMTCDTAGTVTLQEMSILLMASQISVTVTTEAGATATTIVYTAPGNWVITFGDAGDVVTVTAVNTAMASATGTITTGTGNVDIALGFDDDGDASIPTGDLAVDFGGAASYTLPDDEEVVSETTTSVSAKPFTVEVGTGIAVSSDGTLYATDSSAAGEGISRSINPDAEMVPDKDVFFEELDDTVEGPLEEIVRGLWLTEGSSNTLWTIYDDEKIYTLTDTLTGKITLTSPANGASSLRVTSVTFTWDEVADAEEYQIQVDTQENFKGARVLSDTDEDTTYTWDEVPTAYQGIPLYWRVRVNEQQPYRSNWSDKWSFSTQLTEAQWNPFVGDVDESPASGASDVPIRPSFAWNPADWATGYEFILAKDAAFSDTVVPKKTLTSTVYLCEQDLEYSTTYYWKVRAVSSASQSEWGVGVFTTMAKPTTPPPPVTPPTPTLTVEPIITPQPIPSWMLITIIAIGAVLVIAVIVLIVRTRRPL
jgi:hypothetical protein